MQSSMYCQTAWFLSVQFWLLELLHNQELINIIVAIRRLDFKHICTTLSCKWRNDLYKVLLAPLGYTSWSTGRLCCTHATCIRCWWGDWWSFHCVIIFLAIISRCIIKRHVHPSIIKSLWFLCKIRPRPYKVRQFTYIPIPSGHNGEFAERATQSTQTITSDGTQLRYVHSYQQTSALFVPAFGVLLYDLWS